ncbi:MAG: L-seryl-tRNA(Sec) selenium transferase [Xanthobacteraceae bacterium]|nr:MAG: L-seryl-tRNA(Sec) selenium transferase [Xanthobacteraceae bacterium]
MGDATLRGLPSVDEVLRTAHAREAVDRHGRQTVTDAVRATLSGLRSAVSGARVMPVNADWIAKEASAALAHTARPNLRAVYNLTGTVLHTNLGRAVLAEEAIAAAVTAMRQTVALEFDLDSGRRGERDNGVRDLLRDLTGAEDATLVNNNAAAVHLVLNTLANRREAIVSRGEMIEIGGAFRLPDIMARAGVRLIEIGTTNRTHLDDYRQALGARTGLVLKVHTSNYRITGFTAAVPTGDLVALLRGHDVPLINDLGSGTLVDLTRFGLRHEPTVAEAVKEGADLVTFSGDKLLGGPQAGFIVGRRELIARINRNPLKRALRIDKIRLAAIEATLRLYRDPDRLAARLPTLRHLSRPKEEVAALAHHLAPAVARVLAPRFAVTVTDCACEIGSGALPGETVPSAGLAIAPTAARGRGRALAALAAALRKLPVPVIGRIAGDALVLDLRTLEDAGGFAANFMALVLPSGDPREAAP